MMHQPGSSPARGSRTAAGQWTAEQRGAAFRVYFSTGSRRKARRQTGVPERTLSAWLKDARYEEERRAVQAGLLAAVQQGAAQRGAEAVEATREAILVCRKALRGNPDGRTSSSLLSALNRARETEDRIQRLDEGDATEIHGLKLSDEDRAAFEEWREEREATASQSSQELLVSLERGLLDIARLFIAARDDVALRALLGVLAADRGVLQWVLAGDIDLATEIREVVAGAIADAASRSAAPVTTWPVEQAPQ